MSEVHVKEGESLDSALKRFKRSCAKAGVLAEVRKRECYESPSVKRRKKSEAARKNRNKRYYDFVLGKNDLKTWFRFCGTMFSLVVSKSSHRVCRLQAAKPTGCFYMPYAHDMREKPVRREIVEFIRPADNRPLLRKPWLFRRIALQ